MSECLLAPRGHGASAGPNPALIPRTKYSEEAQGRGTQPGEGFARKCISDLETLVPV